MGMMDKLSRRRDCPVCRTLVNTRIRSTELLCKKCSSYLRLQQDVLVTMDPGTVLPEARFAAPLPWRDVYGGVTLPGISLPMAQLTESMLTKKGGTRILDAHWPEQCCVCGKPATRRLNFTQTVHVPRTFGILSLGQKTLRLMARNVPHCDEHSDGVCFGYVPFDSHGTGIELGFGLRFRWLAYRDDYRKLNPDKWPY